MKNSILIALIVFFGSSSSYSQRNTTAPEIDQFLASTEFKRVINDPQWRFLGSVNRSLSYANTILENKGVSVNIVITGRDNRVIAVIEAVKVPDGKYLMPGNERYAMVLRDYANYDFGSSSGTIKYYDLNYKNHLGGIISISKSSIVSWVTYEIPLNLLNQDPGVIKKVHYCDKNGNGNVTFTECYSCMKKACESHDGCDTLCDILNIFAAYCTRNIATSCIFISMAW